jgi:hypothetical protein
MKRVIIISGGFGGIFVKQVRHDVIAQAERTLLSFV